MDYQKFIQQLPELYEDWGKTSVRPKSDQFQQILNEIGGLTTPNVMQLVTFAVGCMEKDEVYCEVGCFQGANLIAALMKVPEAVAYAVDNFSDFDPFGESFNQLVQSLSNFDLENRVFLCDQDIQEFLFQLRELETEDRIGVYFYDSYHDYRSHLMALLLVKPLLAERALIVLSHSNCETARQANWDFLTSHTQCELLLDWTSTKDDGSYISWKGLQVFSWDTSKTRNYDWSTLNQSQNKSVLPAIKSLGDKEKKRMIEALCIKILEFQSIKDTEKTETKYKELLHLDSNKAIHWLNLAIYYYHQEQYRKALTVLIKALKIEPTRADLFYNLGVVLEKVGEIGQAIGAYQKTIELEPKGVQAYNNLGNLFYQSDDIERAEEIYRACIKANPEHFGSYLNLGNVLMERHQVAEAVETYEIALQLNPRDPDILYNLGVALDAKKDPAQATLYYGYSYFERGEYEEAIKYLREYQRTQTVTVKFSRALSACYKFLNQYELAIETLQEAIKVYPKEVILYFLAGLALQEAGRPDEAISFLRNASQVIPDSLALKLQSQLILPILYDTEEQIEVYRQRFVKGLYDLIHQTSLETPEDKKRALEDIGYHNNFYLQYQGKNDLDIQIPYGQFVHQIMAANYTQWSQALMMPPLSQNGKIRIGYVSPCMRAHTVGKLMLGWLRHSNHQNFEVYCYYTHKQIDYFTQKFRLYSDTFRHIPEDIEAVCKQVITDQVHVLVMLDIGMDPQMMQIAALRLAPVQCTTWGHPITSGLPTVDYFLSSDLMEPENAQEHYSEALIRLPNIGISYAKPDLPEVQKARSEFQLREEAVVYLSCQSLFKYLPKYDWVFGAIAQKVPHAQFAFLCHNSVHITEKFRQRLQRAFAEFNLNSEEYCVILPRLNQVDYWALNLVSDVFLDTLSWSGGNTTLEAIACNLPVVTCPGEFMRGRHTYGILKMLGVTDTIAKNEAEYIEIAVKLGLDVEWRSSIIEQMAERHSYLYDDLTCVEALEEFYRLAVRERLSAHTSSNL
ncbi:MAG: tetratricopeptide repeat protein [Microcoleus vaginatus WJT46-NPBG5]|jgi:predicted O-linked N-acetylglucosamine transferase (SPINDLY family)|nr:tetratricopeptide repeat protein [Microcoleus vaginatus WJT46-NPBG5]